MTSTFDRDAVVANHIEKGRKATAYFANDPMFPEEIIDKAVDIFITQTPLPLHPEDAMMYVMDWTYNLIYTCLTLTPDEPIDAATLALLQSSLVGKILEKLHA